MNDLMTPEQLAEEHENKVHMADFIDVNKPELEEYIKLDRRNAFLAGYEAARQRFNVDLGEEDK
jgi:hypothetical protein